MLICRGAAWVGWVAAPVCGAMWIYWHLQAIGAKGMVGDTYSRREDGDHTRPEALAFHDRSLRWGLSTFLLGGAGFLFSGIADWLSR
ncbi:MAG: hypothetical protein WBV82_21880 [Myxococcaceae bacterium]